VRIYGQAPAVTRPKRAPFTPRFVCVDGDNEVCIPDRAAGWYMTNPPVYPRDRVPKKKGYRRAVPLVKRRTGA
jgi:hypothetical protein